MQKTRKRLGTMLVEANLLTEGQLESVLLDQRRSGLKLGEYLIQNSIVRETDILDIVSKQLRIEQYSPQKHVFDVGMSSLVSMEFAQENKLVPLYRQGHLLTIAMVDPMDINALDAVEIMTNMEAESVICSEQVLNELIYSIYGRATDASMAEGFDDIEGMEEDVQLQEEDEIRVDQLEGMAEDAPVIQLVNKLLRQAVNEGASDVHLSPEQKYIQLRFRIDGKLRDFPAPPKQYFLPMVSRLKIMGNMDIAVSMVPQDGRFSFITENREIHVRVSCIPTVHGENIVLRLLDRSGGGLTLEDLGLNPHDEKLVESAIRRPYGMILATGPTGSGKSTTLYAILRQLNRPDINIITLEDPVEYRVEKIRQVQLNTKAGMTFASGLRSILRQDPDVVMVGEIRDGETAAISTQAALTGHMVLSTLHTNDAAGAVTRLMEMGIEPFLVASTLLVAVGQRLVRRNCKYCSESYTPPPEALQAFTSKELPSISTEGFKRGKGCFRCNNTGFKGRIGLYEFLPITNAIKPLILKRASSGEIAAASIAAGELIPMQHDAIAKAMQGLTTLEEAASVILF